MNTNNSISVLTIDDDPDLRKGIVSYLEDKGFMVYQASGGAEGIEMSKKYNPDLVFTDLMMPEVDGIAVVSAIAKDSPDTPVVVISGNGSVAHAIETIRKGAWDYVTKPIHDFSVLDRVTDQVLDRVKAIKSERAYHESLKNAVLSQDRQLTEISSIDTLTKLPLRNQLFEMFGKFIRQAEFSGNLSVMLLEIDNFKVVNETFGHECGDQFIISIADRLCPLITDRTVIARISNNQFAVLTANSKNENKQIRSLSAAFEKPVILMGQDVYISFNIGIALFPQDGESIDTLLHHAEIACAHTKLSGKNSHCYYSRELLEQVQDRIALESGLRKGLERNEFRIYYQPKVDAETRRMVGMEALLRWQPTGSNKLVSPVIFVPILEESGLIVDVGAWVLETACRQYMEWRRQGMGAVRLSVNISAIQFHSGQLAELVARVLHDTGMAPDMLCLELTESIVAKDIKSVVATLRKLANLGVKLSIDDFGTGYSSLSYLKDMPINELKIDRSFVMNLPGDTASVAIVESVLNMSKGMSMAVVAEGVETLEQAEFLIARGCNELQGFLYSKPLPQEEVLSWYREREDT
jgi:diguanylate cyclase (GGDEF)-like protein